VRLAAPPRRVSALSTLSPISADWTRCRRSATRAVEGDVVMVFWSKT